LGRVSRRTDVSATGAGDYHPGVAAPTSSPPPSRRRAPRAGDAPPTVGVYLHVPFCDRVCPYCDFAVVAARPLVAAQEERYVAALAAELAARAGEMAGHALASIYLGGGTPSLLAPASVARLLEAVAGAFPPAQGAAPEVTLEVNPSTLERGRLPGFRAAGVSRLSLGIQSFDDTVLRRLGRAHRAAEALATWEAARAAGFGSLSLDLLYAAPGQTPSALEGDLDRIRALAPEHVSTYALTLEPGTPFARAAGAGRLALPDEDAVVEMMDRIEAALAAAGLARYELSSWARPGHEARHNRRYWSRLPVLGLGTGAWSSLPAGPGRPHGARRANVRGLGDYLAAVEATGTAAAGPDEVLAPATARGETAFLALRTREGLSAAAFAAEFGGPPRAFWPDEITRLAGDGLLDEAASGDLRLTERGRRVADAVGAAFVEAPPG